MKKYISEKQARAAVCEIGRRMYEKNFVAANDGNISVRIGDNVMICTPTGVSKGFMKESDLIKTDLMGNPIEDPDRFGVGCGPLETATPKNIYPKPSSEIKMHAMVYKKNPDATAVVHAHPISATALAVAGHSLEEPIMTESVVVLGPIPLAPYATAGTEEVPRVIESLCRKYKGALLANHGAITWAEDLTTAWYLMESIEQSADIYMKAKFVLGNVNVLSKEDVEKLKKAYGLL